MEQLTKQMLNDITKYEDISNVFGKLQQNGVVQQLSSLFETIFNQEQLYTIQQLAEIMKEKPKDKYFSLSKQIQMNTSIFKSNFDIIIQVIMNSTWEKVWQELSASIQENQIDKDNKDEVQIDSPKKNNEASELLDQEKQQIQPLQQHDTKQQHQQQNSQQQAKPHTNATLQQQDKSNKKEAQSQEKSPQQSQKLIKGKAQSILQSTSLTNSIVQEAKLNQSWVKRQINQQKSREQFQNSSGYLSRKDNLFQNQSQSMQFQDFKKQQEKKLMNFSHNMSMSSMRSYNSQNQSKLGGPVPFSELQGDVRSNTSFSRAQREVLNKSGNIEYSPGPAEYKIDRGVNVVRKASPNTKFERSAKVSWIDEKLKHDSSVQSPGPKYDYQKIKTSGKNKKQVKQNK